MRSLWNGLCILALANLLAIGGIAAWLLGTGRLDKARMTRLREVLSVTVADETAQIEEASAQVEQATQQAELAARELEAPLSAAEQLHVRLDLSEVDHQRIERLRQETADLTVAVDRDQQRLAEERREFAAEKDAFDRMRAELAAVEGSAQFRKAVGTLQGLKPQDAVAILMEILRIPGGTAESIAVVGGSTSGGAGRTAGIPVMTGGPEPVVAYLNALQERARNKIMAEITANDPALAADLLERLRTRGQIARTPEPVSR